jgi:hypothetical protein
MPMEAVGAVGREDFWLLPIERAFSTEILRPEPFKHFNPRGEKAFHASKQPLDPTYMKHRAREAITPMAFVLIGRSDCFLQINTDRWHVRHLC